MAGLNISVSDNVGDKIVLYWRPGGSNIKYFKLYGSAVSEPAFAATLLKPHVPNYPSQGPIRGAVVEQLSRISDLGISTNAPYYFRITEVNSNGVESSVVVSPERALQPEEGPRFAKDLSVTSATFTNNPQFNWGFWSTGIVLVNVSGGSTVEYSFDGVTVHGKLGVTGAPDNGKVFDDRHERSVWFRAPADSTIRVEVWDHTI